MNKQVVKEPGLIQKKDEVKITRANIGMKMAEMYEKDHELVEGEFISREPGKNCFDFRFKKWKQDDYIQYSLEHRKRYTLPRMLAHHINQGIHHVEYKDVPGKTGIKQSHSSNDGVFVGAENLKIKVILPRCEFRPSVYDPEDTYINQPKLVDVSIHM